MRRSRFEAWLGRNSRAGRRAAQEQHTTQRQHKEVRARAYPASHSSRDTAGPKDFGGRALARCLAASMPRRHRCLPPLEQSSAWPALLAL